MAPNRWPKRPAQPAPADAVVAGDLAAADAFDLEPHFCVCCRRPLGDDPEDEIDGEGPGRDICGNCNRERNWLAIDEMDNL